MGSVEEGTGDCAFAFRASERTIGTNGGKRCNGWEVAHGVSHTIACGVVQPERRPSKFVLSMSLGLFSFIALFLSIA